MCFEDLVDPVTRFKYFYPGVQKALEIFELSGHLFPFHVVLIDT